MNTAKNMKEHKGRKYTGAPVDYTHNWNYDECEVRETKKEPDEWKFHMKSIKRRKTPTNNYGNIEKGTEYHWLFIGEQKVKKISPSEYQTDLVATKYKLGHKRPTWRAFSYMYPEQKSINQMKIEFLRKELLKIETYKPKTQTTIKQYR